MNASQRVFKREPLQLRTQPRPAIDYITNQFIDVHRSSGRSHVLGAMLTNTETQGDHFDVDFAARQGLANRAGNCDRVNAARNRMITRQRVEAFSQLDEQFPETTRSSLAAQEGGRRPSSARLVATRLGSNALAEASVARNKGSAAASPTPQTGLSLHHVTPMHTLVTDLQTGEVLMEMHGSQIPVDKVNHGFPIKDPQTPYAIHPDYVSSTDPFRCHANVKVKRVELPPETEAIMRSYFPVAAAKPGYFAARAAEIKAEYEAPLNNQTPPSALRWKPKRLTAQECYSQAQAKALVGAFGVVAVDDSEQNVGGMGPSFAGAELKTAAQRRQYIAQTSKGAFDDFSMRAGNPNNPRELARFAPYGGGNLAQFMNGKATPEDQAHFIVVDVIDRRTLVDWPGGRIDHPSYASANDRRAGGR
ncbi:hypothetical protein [Pseudomonas sp. GL-B-16]|uniref:hypothetical protein n=1 Tax=Pseudomonas sp. GL-B-16 TaxID=2832373 RepID=UPI001CC1433D|nr:hypothetical protein [Pseudomonas sp. GL-B-16]